MRESVLVIEEKKTELCYIKLFAALIPINIYKLLFGESFVRIMCVEIITDRTIFR